jgi:tRNA-2-methylthio-N6-dimethylallyladenosine synthase
VQSGSSTVLGRMQRLYTRQEYLTRIEWMKRARREIAISTDIIVGFPGETQEDFDQTLSLLDAVGYDSVFSFKYSPRPNTPALSLPDQVPDQEKGRRLMVLQERQRAIQIRRNSLLIGRREEVLVEGFNAATGQWIGRTSQNRTLNFTHASLPAPDGRTLVGRYLPVRVTRAGPNSLVGEWVDLI